MRPKVFRSTKWRQVCGLTEMIGGIGLIVTASRFAAEQAVQMWPGLDLAVYGVLTVIAILLSWAWVKIVLKAIEEGEFD